MIRPATAADLPAIRELASQSPEAAQWSEQHYADLGAASSTRLALVAESAGAVVGFLVANEIAGEWELENVAVAASERRKGIATRLLAELAKTCVRRGSRVIHLEVRGQNRGARAFYEREGFVQRGVRKGYYECPKDDAVLYTLENLPSTLEKD